MTTNRQFIAENRHKFIDFKPKIGSRTRGLPVGEFFVITDGYTLYNSFLRIPVIKQKFLNVIDCYDLCKKLIEVYGHFLWLLEDEKYARHTFRMTRYSIPNGMKIYDGIRSFEKLDKIRRPDLAFILDE